MKSNLKILSTQFTPRIIFASLALAVVVLVNSCSQNKKDPSAHAQMADMAGMVQENNLKDSSMLQSLVLPVNLQVISSQQSVKPTLKAGAGVIEARGYISPDETRNKKVASRIAGRIEKLFVKYNLQYVRKGDKIMEVYSPDLNTYQEELIYLTRNKANQNLIDQAIKKLRLLGISENQINKLVTTGVPFFSLTVYSPQNGYVFFKPAGTSAKNKMGEPMPAKENKMGGMEAVESSSPDFVSESQQVREGDYVNKGDVLFWINDLRQVWGVVSVSNIHEQELKLNAQVSLVSELFKPDTLKARVNFIEPTYQPEQKFIKARIFLSNPNGKYKINSLVTAEIATEQKSSVWVPYSSLLFLGKRKIVWVLKESGSDANKIYEARDVVTGLCRDEMIEIKKGINASEEIALNAAYLLDRESLIKPE